MRYADGKTDFFYWIYFSHINMPKDRIIFGCLCKCFFSCVSSSFCFWVSSRKASKIYMHLNHVCVRSLQLHLANPTFLWLSCAREAWTVRGTSTFPPTSDVLVRSSGQDLGIGIRKYFEIKSKSKDITLFLTNLEFKVIGKTHMHMP